MSTPRGLPGSAGDELFLPSNNPGGVAPLRINKRPTSFDNQSNASSGSHPSSIAESTPLPYPNPRRPTFPHQDYSPEETDRPPLPYPDKPAHERNKRQEPSAVPGLPQLPYPGLDPFQGRNNRYSYADTLPSPSPSSVSTISTTSTVPGRHVSVKEADDFPIPPPFRHGRDEERPFTRIPNRKGTPGSASGSASGSEPPSTNPYPEFHQQYWPPSGSGGRDNGANKYNMRPESTVSVMTTAGRRGSPAPPETPATATNEHPPITVFGGRNTPTQPKQTPHSPPPRPWTPTEDPGSAHAPPTVWQGPGRPQSPPGQAQAQRQEQQRQEQQRQEQQRQEQQRQEQQRAEQQRLDRERQERQREEQERLEQQRLDQQRQERERQQREEQQRQEQQRQAEQARLLQQQQQQQQQQHPALRQDTPQGARPGASPAPLAAGQPRPDPIQLSDSKVQSLATVEQDFDRLNLSASPPPSYASLGPPPAATQPSTTAQGYPNEKHTVVIGAGTDPVDIQGHPAFQPAVQAEPARAPTQIAPVQQTTPQPQPQVAGPSSSQQPAVQNLQHQPPQFTPPPGSGPSSPPPLPEGWMAHLDQSSGQYYYIHIPTQRTQWEFPQPEVMSPSPQPMLSSPPPTQMMSPMAPMMSPGMSPGPMNMMSPPPGQFMQSPPPGGMMSPPPGGMFPSPSPFPGQYGASPMPGMMGGYSDPSFMMSPPPSHMMNQPPPPTLPTSGIAMYNIAPANGDYFGPYLRYTNMDIENGIWLGSILICTQDQPPTVHLHQSLDLSPNPRQLKAHPIFQHKTWTFYRYDIDIQMSDSPAKWTYAVTSHLGCTRFEFLVAGRFERSWRFVAHSCNDFSVAVSAQERSRLGGTGFMWKDLLQKHMDVGGFHAQVGLGDQVYADRIWKELPLLRDWLHIKGKEQRKAAPWTAAHEEEVTHAYFHYYSSHFDQPFIREAFAQIPHLLQLDDHDIFDGYGSYPEHLQFSNMFKNIGRIGYQFYLLFQHHTTLEILRQVPDDRDLFTITGTGWHFIKYLGPTIAVVGTDNRSERNQHQVMAGPTYQGLFPKIANVHPAVQHVIIMVGVPIIYPRMSSAESFVNTIATTKKVANGTYNFLGKAVGSVAGVVGAKQVVGEAFNSVKKGVGKHGLMSSVVSVFGEVDVLDDLRDHWTHESKDLERTYFIRTLQGIAHNRSIRITFLSGDVHTCGAGLVHDPMHPSDHKTMYQIITSGIVNIPPPALVMKLLHSPQINHIPQNGVRSSTASSDTKEEMIELFQQDVTGQPRDHKKLMNRRNYAIFIPFDPVPPGQGGTSAPPLSLAVDFIVQNEGIYSPPAKYGPVVIPRLEFGY